MNASEVWLVFGCSNPECAEVLALGEATISSGGSLISINCEACGQENRLSSMYKGERWKYCRVCEQLQPLANFHLHAPNQSSFRSGRQLECKTCKKRINATLNPRRTREQLAEGAEGRRLYGTLSKDRTLPASLVATFRTRFQNRCFNCDQYLEFVDQRFDHTLPAKYLWPLATGPTLLCERCNGRKAETWPSNFYLMDSQRVDLEKLKVLSYLTGIDYQVLAGPPHINPVALEEILSNVDDILTRNIKYLRSLKRLRRDIIELEGIDIRNLATGDVSFFDEG